MKQKIYLLLFLISGICCLNSSFAQDPNFSVEIASPAYINSNTYEFNIVVKAINTTTSFQLRTFQAGIYVNSAWLNGGSLTIQTVPTFTELSSPGYNGNYQWNNTDKLINCSVNYGVKPTAATCISSLVGTVNTTVTRIRLVNSATFTCNTPDLKFNYVQNMSPLRLRTSVSWRINNSCATNYDLFYPNRTYSGVVKFNGETYSLSDVDGRSPVIAAVNAGFCFSQLKLTAFIQGFYQGGHQMESTLMIQGAPHGQPEQTDSITIELHPAATPAVISQSYRSVLNANGDAYALFPSSVNGSSYYIAVKGRNLLETWSANPITMNANFN